ncbi:MAG TPA: TIGR00341 family protein [Jiangellales bacterium]|nr:TIGR00341 family protein [Jiangellales bacterium]
MPNLSGRVLPPQQRKSLDEVTDGLYLMVGDTASKVSAFWTMLVLSGVIATAGVIADSTATVIGAMIIAPLSTPIMGMAIAVVEGNGRRLLTSAAFVAGGATSVVLLGVLASVAIPSSTDLLANGQISGRTSPNLADLVAAVATGFAGAVGLSRRDVSDVLPGVAIAISLVPPLAVVGVTLGQGAVSLALGALVLFLSNVVALVLAGTLTFTAAGYAREAYAVRGFPRRRAYVGIAVTLALVLVPLAANTAGNIYVSVTTAQVRAVAEEWVQGSPGAAVTSVQVRGNRVVVQVRADAEVPSVDRLRSDLAGVVPAGTDLTVVVERGRSIDAGAVTG